MMQGRETSPDIKDKEVAGQRDIPPISEEQTLNS